MHNLVEDTPQQPWQIQEKKLPLNLILYGPPGTGKTYKALQYALSLTSSTPIQTIAQLNAKDRNALLQQLQENEQLVLVTFHAGYSYEDFVQGLRPNTQASTLLFEKKEGIFKQLVRQARKNYEDYTQAKASPPLAFEDLFNLFLSQALDPETEEIEIALENQHRIFKSIIIYDIREDALLYRRRTKNDIIKEEERVLSFRKLKALYEGKAIKEALNEKYYQAVVESLKTYKYPAPAQEGKRELKNFVLVIDEINRGNLSAVFGELITLIEPDKRLGASNQMILTLASGDELGIPPNLYIIGTMNTADKSLTLIDVAMRRRFVFESVFPDVQLIENQRLKVVFQQLNEQIYQIWQRTDFLIGHTFFMQKDEQSIVEVFNQQIIPLLEAYFPNQPQKVKQLLEAVGLVLDTTAYQLRVSKV